MNNKVEFCKYCTAEITKDLTKRELNILYKISTYKTKQNSISRQSILESNLLQMSHYELDKILGRLEDFRFISKHKEGNYNYYSITITGTLALRADIYTEE